MTVTYYSSNIIWFIIYNNRDCFPYTIFYEASIEEIEKEDKKNPKKEDEKNPEKESKENSEKEGKKNSEKESPNYSKPHDDDIIKKIDDLVKEIQEHLKEVETP